MCEEKWLVLLRLLNLTNFAMARAAQDVRVSELNSTCIQCLCYLNGCDLSAGCKRDVCGPFKISKDYWLKADKPHMPYDSSEWNDPYEDCTKDYVCSVRTIQNFVSKNARDCNGDGIIDCTDYVTMHFYQGTDCWTPLFLTADGLRWLTRYEKCQSLNDLIIPKMSRKPKIRGPVLV